MAVANPAEHLSPVSRVWAEYGPGVMVSFMIAASAHYISTRLGGPVMLYALLFGMALNFLSDSEKCMPGITFASKTVLRLGVALLGLQITWMEVVSLGWSTTLLVIAGVLVTIVGGFLIARLLELDKNFSLLSAGAVAICGASAALAIASVLPEDKKDAQKLERNTLLTVVGVTALSTVAMIAYPVIIGTIGLDDVTAGVFLGATIHDVAQVIGAGYMISDETGEVAAIVKLLRVACLVPVVAIIGFLFRKGYQETSSSVGARPPIVPLFLVGFIVCIAIGSFGLLPEAVMDTLTGASRWFLIAAVAALGMKTSLGKLLTVGYAPVLALVAQTCLLAVFVLFILH